MNRQTGNRFIALRYRRASRAMLFLAALRGPAVCGALVTEALYQHVQAMGLGRVGRGS